MNENAYPSEDQVYREFQILNLRE